MALVPGLLGGPVSDPGRAFFFDFEVSLRCLSMPLFGTWCCSPSVSLAVWPSFVD